MFGKNCIYFLLGDKEHVRFSMFVINTDDVLHTYKAIEQGNCYIPAKGSLAVFLSLPRFPTDGGAVW